MSPAKTELVEAVLPTAKSVATSTTDTPTDVELLPETTSVTEETTLAVFVIEPTVSELAMIVIVAVALLARVPMLQVTIPFV